MTEVAWLVTGERSGLTFLTKPDGDRHEISAAVERLDTTSAAMTNPPRPAWYRAVSKLGYLWYVLIGVVVLAVLLAVSDLTITRALLIAVISAAILGPVTGGLLTAVAGTQAKIEGADDAAHAAALAEKALVRIPQPGTVEAVRVVLAADAAQESRVHQLAWQTSATFDLETDPDASAAADQLFDLQDRLDPESA